jgi:hypothetical protein
MNFEYRSKIVFSYKIDILKIKNHLRIIKME